MEENNEEQIDTELEYLAEILVESFLEKKGYSSYDWLYGTKRWRKEYGDPVGNSDIVL